MRIRLFSKVYLMLLFLSISLIVIGTVSSESSLRAEPPLETRILDISLRSSLDGNGYTEYIFDLIGEIRNKNENSFSIDHPNTCGFSVYIDPIKIEGDASVYSSIACGDAITPITYSPGASNFSMVGAVIVQSSVSTSLPNGYYEITLGEPFIGVYQDKVTFVKTSMTVSEGVPTFTNSISDPDLGNTIISDTNTIDPVTSTISPTASKSTEILVSSSQITTSDQTNTGTDNDAPDAVSETLNFNFGIFLVGILLLTALRTFIKRSVRF